MLGHWTLLWDQSYEVEGLRFVGLRYLPDGDDAAGIAALLDGDSADLGAENGGDGGGGRRADVLISHNPPHGVLDSCRKGTHGGHTALRSVVEAHPPKLHLFGHMHAGRGVERVNWGSSPSAAARRRQVATTSKRREKGQKVQKAQRPAAAAAVNTGCLLVNAANCGEENKARKIVHRGAILVDVSVGVGGAAAAALADSI